jgi:hypothetical protein
MQKRWNIRQEFEMAVQEEREKFNIPQENSMALVVGITFRF